MIEEQPDEPERQTNVANNDDKKAYKMKKVAYGQAVAEIEDKINNA